MRCKMATPGTAVRAATMATEAALPAVPTQRTRLQEFLAHDRAPPAKAPTHVTNDVSDIHGARPLLKDHVFVKKPHYYDPHDIQGSSSKELHPKTRRISSDERYQQLPIEGSTTQPAGFRTNRICNPLNPEYKLPSFKEAPPIVPKFLRDSFDVSDIEGTSFRKCVITNPRSLLRLDDIPGSQPGWLPSHKRGLREHPPRDILDVADIINVDFKSSRVTNVLDPVYTVNGMTTESDALMHPKQLHRPLHKPHFALQTADIAGASAHDAGKIVVSGIPNEKRRHFRPTNRTDDIVGAGADTVLHSIRSNRRVDPNWPEYDVLDGKRVDSSAMSVAKSIVFAELTKQHDVIWRKEEPQGQYIVSGVANVGMTGIHREKETHPRRSTAPAIILHAGVRSTTDASGRSSSTVTTRLTPADKKHADERRKEIEMVRDLK